MACRWARIPPPVREGKLCNRILGIAMVSFRPALTEVSLTNGGGGFFFFGGDGTGLWGLSFAQGVLGGDGQENERCRVTGGCAPPAPGAGGSALLLLGA